MIPRMRVLVNMTASYSRTLIAAGLGLFSVRWVLDALGASDYGLYAVVGSLIVFISFFNNILGISISRFYAYSIGHGENVSPEEAVKELSGWFNTAFSLHILVPIALLVIGYPVAVYAIRHWVNIPPDRIATAVWVFRVSCVTAFVSMVSVPFVAMYTARQLIFELSFFGIFAAAFNFIAAYHLKCFNSDRLLVYALFMMVVNAGIPIVQIALAVFRFRECRPKLTYMFNRKRFFSLMSFAGWTFFGFSGYTIGNQGNVFATNHYFGSLINTAYGISNQLVAQAGALASALMGAITPAVTTRAGKGDIQGTIQMAYRTGKFGAFLLIFFAIPLASELPEVLRLWLKNPPLHVVPICTVALVGTVLSKLTMGHQMAMNASGKIALWQFVEGSVLAGMVILTIFLAILGIGPVAAACAYAISMILSGISVVCFARHVLGMPIRPWLSSVFLPIIITMLLSALGGGVPVLLLSPSLARIVLTTICSCSVSLAAGWFIVLDIEERTLLNDRIKAVLGKVADTLRGSRK